jgi:hypothetical protein
MSLHILILHFISPLVRPPGPGIDGGFIVPGGPGAPDAPGSPAASSISVRPPSIFSRARQLFSFATVPLGDPSALQFPQVSTPQPTQQYPIGTSPVPTRGYGMPNSIESPLVPSPPSWDGGALLSSLDLGSIRGSFTIPPQQVSQSAVHASDDELYTPLEPSYSTRTPGIESPRSPSLAPVIFPDPQISPRQPSHPMFVHTPPQPPPSQLGRTPSPPRSRSPTPPPIPGQPTIIVPPQPDVVSSAIPLILTKSVYDERPDDSDESGLVPSIPDQPLFQVGASPCPGHLELPEFDDRQEGPSNQYNR